MAVISLLITGYLLLGGGGGVGQITSLQRELKALEEENGRLMAENQRLTHEIHRLKTDHVYVGRLAREELNLVKPEEVIYRFTP